MIIKSPPLLYFLLLFALKETVYSFENIIEYYQLEIKSSQYQKHGVSCHKLESFFHAVPVIPAKHPLLSVD